jgi:hypothetical protein
MRKRIATSSPIALEASPSLICQRAKKKKPELPVGQQTIIRDLDLTRGAYNPLRAFVSSYGFLYHMRTWERPKNSMHPHHHLGGGFTHYNGTLLGLMCPTNASLPAKPLLIPQVISSSYIGRKTIKSTSGNCQSNAIITWFLMAFHFN